ncbi:hypothetical protein KAFR_0E01320 [Kazachstania africana CBS 2517]|uniref:Protein CFT1 n=1 Tax=Kazachstania africana (strain ATCC 22294 / BCRC 22015 / CBS 2517 / CECT 1963 / NBRC 1671 / NRRL Y-8276) TaxID=1071382 RepID=H2AV86_KAZAF|nr:hypothetical protein KAFR_0E01320 [Kazachstania africana CBS 2517]CCF58286.1 hypothetical protein KAFR_0E01320 [Kazachstania africana CBS 2517]
MNVYDDVLEPTVVSHSVTGNFTTDLHKELITVRTNILSIYEVSADGLLFLTNEFKFDGRITDIALLPRQDAALDYLLLCTAVAKISIVKFDLESNSIETVSLHYYEDKFKDLSLAELTRESKLRLDPASRCLVLFNEDNIAVLPFVMKEDEEDDDEEGEEEDEDTYEPRIKRFRANINGRVTFPSTILSAKTIHEDIQNIIDIEFLNNYSKPTVAILYQPKLTWVGNLQLHPLPTKLLIVTLECNTNGFETSLSHIVIARLNELPWDWHRLIPVTNGIVIVGINELAYVDNTGVLQTVILLNSFADRNLKKSRIIDHSKEESVFNHSAMKHICILKTTDGNEDDADLLLLMDDRSNLYYVQMISEGRLMTQFDIIKLPIINNIFINNLNPTSISRLDSSSSRVNLDLFFGFQSGDAFVCRLNNIKSAVETRKEHKDVLDYPSNADEYDEDGADLYGDDDLYSDEATSTQRANSKENGRSNMIETVEPFDIALLSSLNNIGPLTSLTSGKVSAVDQNNKGLSNPNNNELSIVATSGNGTGSHLTAVLPSVRPEIELALKFISITQIWNLKFKGKDKFLVTTDSTKSKSDIYEIDNNFALHREGRLRRDATTVSIAMFGSDKRIVQVTTNHLYLLDTTFRRLNTIKFDYEVVHVSVMDPYILITVSRGDIKVYELEQTQMKKLFKVDLPEILKEIVVTSGLILRSNMCNEFLQKSPEEEELLFTFVTADNQIIFFPKDHNDRVFQLNGVSDLKEKLFISTYQLPDEIIPDPSIKQVMINKLGHNFREEYLTILTYGGEIYQYKKSSTRHSRFYKNLYRNNLLITGAPNNAYAKGVSSIERIMHFVPNYNDYSVIFVTGSVPYIIIKEDDATSRVFRFANIPLVSMSGWGKKSVMCVDDIKNARVYTLDHKDIYYGNKFPLKSIKINTELEDYMTFNKITYHEKTQTYVIAYNKEIDYVAKAEDGELLVGYKQNVPHAKGFQSGLLLINPKSWNVIDKVEFEENSLVNDIRSMIIQIDSRTKRKREYIVAGFSAVGTEDLPPSGSFHLYDITAVVPEPGKPDTNYKFERFFKEEVRGSVTSVCEISGRFAISQSQKIMVRDAQEDGSVVPVAFLDIPIFVTDMKSFGNLMIISDAMHGFQFVGFDAEPYRMIQLGKSVSKFKTMSVEFLVNNGDIYFAVTDRDNILHVLKYAPDEPNSFSGQKLVHCSSFNLYADNSCMVLLAKNDEFNKVDDTNRTYQVVGGQTDGSMFKIVPLSEESYRRLYVIQQQIIDKETQLGGLNPRMERLSNQYLPLCHVMRPMLDFNVIRKFSAMPISKRQALAQKLGRNVHFEAWRDLINIEYSLRSLRDDTNI